MKRQYRTRPLRGKSKPYTVDETATLLQWITTYSFMCQNPRAFFANWQIPYSELQEVYDAGFHGVALSLGYQPYAEAVTRPQNIDLLHQPIVCSVAGKAA